MNRFVIIAIVIAVCLYGNQAAKKIGKYRHMKHPKPQQKISTVRPLKNQQTMGSSNVMAGRIAQT